MKQCFTLFAITLSLSGWVGAVPADWKTYRAKDDSFTCAYPPQAKLSLEEMSVGSGQVIITLEAGGRRKALYQVGWTAQVKPKATNLTEAAEGGTLKDQKEVEIAGHKGMQARIEQSGKPPVLVRTFVGRGRAYTLFASNEDDPALAQEFMDGVQLPLDRDPLQDPPAAIDWKPFKAKDGSFSCTLPAKFSGSIEDGAYWGICSLPQRTFSVRWETKTKDLTKLKAELAKNKVRWKAPTKDSVESVTEELTLYGPEMPKVVHHSLVRIAAGRAYTIRVIGPKGDTRLEADARKVFDSFRPKQK